MKTPLITRGFFLLIFVVLGEVHSAPLEKKAKNSIANNKPLNVKPGNKEWKMLGMVNSKGKSTLKKDETQPIQPDTPILPDPEQKSQKQAVKPKPLAGFINGVANGQDDLEKIDELELKPAPQKLQNHQQQKVQFVGKALNQMSAQHKGLENIQTPRPQQKMAGHDNTKPEEQININSAQKQVQPVKDNKAMAQNKPLLSNRLNNQQKPSTIRQHPEQDVSVKPNQDVVPDTKSAGSSADDTKQSYEIHDTPGDQIHDYSDADMMMGPKKPKFGNAPFVETPSGYQVDTIDDNTDTGGDESNGFQQRFEDGRLPGESNSFLGTSPNQMESDSYNGGLLDMNNGMTGDGEMAEAMGGKNMFEGNNPIMGLGAGTMRSLSSYGGEGRQSISGMLGVSPMSQMNGLQGYGGAADMGGLNGLSGMNGMAGYSAMSGVNGLTGMGGLGAGGMPDYGGQTASTAWYKSGIMSPRRPHLFAGSPGLLHLGGLGMGRMYGYPRAVLPHLVPSMMLFRPRYAAVMGKKRGKMPRPKHKSYKRKHKPQKVKQESGKTKSIIAHKHKAKEQKKHKQSKHTKK